MNEDYDDDDGCVRKSVSCGTFIQDKECFYPVRSG